MNKQKFFRCKNSIIIDKSYQWLFDCRIVYVLHWCACECWLIWIRFSMKISQWNTFHQVPFSFVKYPGIHFKIIFININKKFLFFLVCLARNRTESSRIQIYIAIYLKCVSKYKHVFNLLQHCYSKIICYDKCHNRLHFGPGPYGPEGGCGNGK